MAEPVSGRRGRSIVAARLLLAAGALLAPLVGLEAALRAFGAFLPGTYRTGADLVAHPVFGHFHRPNAVAWVRTPEFATEVRINAAGLRERDLPHEKAPGLRRILVLGDSFVEGVQVDAAQTLTAQLEALLDGRSRSGRTEVINAGVGGFGTAQEWLYFREEGHRYRPDLVLLAFYVGNDVRDNSYRLDTDTRRRTTPYFAVGPDGAPRPMDLRPRRAGASGSGEDWVRRILRESLLYNVFETGVLEKLGREDDIDEGYKWSKGYRVFEARDAKDWEEAWGVTEALVAALKREVEGRGARLALAAVPVDLQVRPADWQRLLRDNELKAEDFDLEKPNRRLAGIAARLGLPLVDLLPELRRAEAASPAGLYFRRNRHWTAEGHAAGARAVADFLAEAALAR